MLHLSYIECKDISDTHDSRRKCSIRYTVHRDDDKSIEFTRHGGGCDRVLALVSWTATVRVLHRAEHCFFSRLSLSRPDVLRKRLPRCYSVLATLTLTLTLVLGKIDADQPICQETCQARQNMRCQGSRADCCTLKASSLMSVKACQGKSCCLSRGESAVS